MQHNFKFLIIEDDQLNTDILATMLGSHGKVFEASNSKEAERILDTIHVDIAFVDIDLNGEQHGFDLAKKSKSMGIYTVILTGQKDKESISKGFTYSNCDNYLYKPANVLMIDNILNHFKIHRGIDPVKEVLNKKFPTKCLKFAEALDIIRNIYQSNQPVYLFGPTGSGKQILAEEIHRLKFGSLEKFYHLNCSAIQDTMIESELFGHLKGSFTGAENKKIGLFEIANNGTLFLDEIATMSLSMQNKIITAIENKKFRPIGSDKEVNSSFRLIAATSGNLTEEISLGKFRSDLFFRLSGTSLTIPSLKERITDLSDLIDSISQTHPSQNALFLNETVLKVLSQYDWPGNIRELKNLIFSWLDRGISSPEIRHIPSQILSNESASDKKKFKYFNKKQLLQIQEEGYQEFLRNFEKELFDFAYRENKKKVRQTARMLGVHTDKVYSIIERSTERSV